MKFSIPWKTPRPVADIRPWIPPWLMGLPVTHACALMSCKKTKGLVRHGINQKTAGTRSFVHFRHKGKQKL